MNARQKAKRFKQLYERTLATTKVPYTVEYTPLKQYALVRKYSIYEAEKEPEELLMKRISSLMSHDLIPLIKDNMIVSKDIYEGKYICRLDVWVRN